MIEANKIERLTLIFPEANAYSVDDVLNFISVVVFPVDPDLHQVDKNTEHRKEYKAYLIERLLEAVVGKNFELWDTYLGKVVAPPLEMSSSPSKVLEATRKPSTIKSFWKFLIKKFSKPSEPGFIKASENPAIDNNNPKPSFRYKTNFWWAKMTSILKPDLVKFCNAERFIVTFENEEKQADEQAADQVTTFLTVTETGAVSIDSFTPQLEDQPKQKTKDVSTDEKRLTDNLNVKSSQADNTQLALSESNVSANGKPSSKRKEKRLVEIQESIKNFPNLPDSAFVEVEVVAGLFKCSVQTIWRRVRKGQLVKPHHLGTRTTRWQVGEIRQALQDALKNHK